MSEHKEIDREYYLTSKALEKLFAHPDREITDASLDALIELRKKRQEYFRNLAINSQVSKVKQETKEKPKTVDLKLKPEEVQSYSREAPNFSTKIKGRSKRNRLGKSKKRWDIYRGWRDDSWARCSCFCWCSNY